MKKKIIIIFHALIVISLMSSCSKNALNDFKEDGYFQYIIWSNNNARIVGLTELGSEQEIITIPTMLGGFKVAQVVYDIGMWGGTNGHIKSNNLKKIYIPHDILISRYAFEEYSCPALQSIYLISNDLGTHNFSECDALVYRSSCVNLQEKANISYMYNYSNAPNEGYYWIDNVPYGEKIEYIPAVPERNGYKFQYWYYIEDNQNIKWDFDVNTTPEAIYEEEDEEGTNGEEKTEVYQETVLYAMWE